MCKSLGLVPQHHTKKKKKKKNQRITAKGVVKFNKADNGANIRPYVKYSI
jgi:hypothetical protein